MAGKFICGRCGREFECVSEIQIHQEESYEYECVTLEVLWERDVDEARTNMGFEAWLKFRREHM